MLERESNNPVVGEDEETDLETEVEEINRKLGSKVFLTIAIIAMVIFSGLVLLIFIFDVCYKNKIVKMLEIG